MQEAVQQKPAGTCAGFCCEAFIIGSPEDVAGLEERWGEDGRKVQDLVIHLGKFSNNPTGRVPKCGTSVVAGEGADFHTCKAFDRETRRCTVYADRPNMCRSYPNLGYCQFDGCDHGPTKGPNVGKTKTEIQAEEAITQRIYEQERRMSHATEIIPEGMKKVLVYNARPATETAMATLLVPVDSDEDYARAQVFKSLATRGQDAFWWELNEGNSVRNGDITVEVIEDVIEPTSVIGQATLRKVLATKFDVREDADAWATEER